MKGQNINVMVIDNVQMQGKSHSHKLFIDICSNSCIVVLQHILAEEKSIQGS